MCRPIKNHLKPIGGTTFFNTLKIEFDTEKDFIKNEIVRLTKEQVKALDKVDYIEQTISQYKAEFRVATKYEKDNLRSHLIRNDRPICPRCLIRSVSHNEMFPQDSNNENDLFYCKICGWDFEISP